MPGAAQSQAYDRYAYVRNSPVRYTDPTGHRDCEECGRDNQHDPVYAEYYDYVYYGLHSNEERETNSRKVEKVVAAVEIGTSIVSNTADIAWTTTHCIMGDCGYATLIFAALPFLPAAAGKYVDDIAPHVVKTAFSVIERTEGHHTIPRQILNLLPQDLRKAVQVKNGAPNIWDIPKSVHRLIHSGPGNGGYYNAVWRDAVEPLLEGCTNKL